jgi:hypothetical protein
MLNKYVIYLFFPFFAIFWREERVGKYTHYLCVAIKEVEKNILFIYLFILT